MLERVRWVATPPFRVGRPPPRPAPAYQGPPRYRYPPRWGFPPSVWVRTAPADHPQPGRPAPLSELRTAAFLTRAVAGLCLIAAGSEVWRYTLLVRGRTALLSAREVGINDVLTLAAGRAATVFGAAAVLLSVLPALGRTAAFAAQRAGVRDSRGPAERLFHLLVPGWNLYGAGVVLAEIDALVASPAPAAPAPRRRGFRWLAGEIPALGSPVRPDPPPAPEVVPHRRSGRRVLWWWLAWVVNGVLAATVLVRSLIPGDLQVQADLVLWRAALDLSAAVVAVLTVSLLDRWRRTFAADRRAVTPPGRVVLAPPSLTRAGPGR